MSLSHEGLEATVPDESLLVTEHIKTYTYHGGSSDKFIKVWTIIYFHIEFQFLSLIQVALKTKQIHLFSLILQKGNQLQ